MANTGRNIEEEEEFLRLQKQINDAVKDNVNSFREMGTYTKNILENYADMQKLSVKIKQTEKQIADLLAEGTEESRQQAAILQQEVEILKKQHDQLKAINKEMASFKNLSKATFQSLLTYIKDAATGYLDFDQKSRDVAASLGLGNERMYMMRQNIIQAGVNMAHYGVSVEQAVEAQAAYSDELGRSVILTENALTNMAKIGKATGLGMQGMAGLTAQMELFGLGAEQSSQFIFDMYAESAAMGLNAGKVIKKFESNLELLNKLNFKAGVKGLKEMAKFSEKYKLDMNAVASVADKVFRPEGAIEAAAQLQILGGSLAALGDPFQLMYKARNSPEELAKSLTEAATASAVFNKKTGEFEVNAYELDRLRESAQALGMDYQELVKTAKQGAKISMFEGLLAGKGLKPEEQDAIAMMTQMVDGKAQIQMGFKDGKAVMKDISSLSQTELLSVLEEKKKAEEAAATATGMKEKWENLLNEFIVALYPMLEALQKDLRPTLEKLFEWGKSFALTIKDWMTKLANSPIAMFLLKWGLIIGAIGKVLGPLFSIAGWYLKGLTLGKGFNASTKQGDLVSSLTGKMGKGGAGTTTGGMTGAQTAMQGQAAKATGMGDMMKSLGSAAKILAIAGALWILSEALINFNQVEWSSLVKGGIAMIGFGLALEFLEPALMGLNAVGWQASLVMLALGASILMLSGGLFLMGQVPLANLIVGFLGLIGVLFTFSLLAPVLAVGELVLLGLGAAFLMIGGAIAIAALGFSVLVDSFTNMFAVIGPNGASLLMAGVGFMAMAAGIGILTISLIAMGAAALFALPGLLILGEVTSMLTETASALQSTGGGEGIAKAVNAINSVDQNKLDALKDLSMWMALVGASPTIKFDESLTIDGSIQLTGQAGGKSNTDWVSDPIFVSKLKELIADATESDKRGGKK